MGIAPKRLLAVGDRPREILGHVADGGPLVPALRELGGALDDAGEHALRGLELLPLDRLDALAEEPVHVRNAGVTPHLPERGLRARHERGVGVADCGERFGLGYRGSPRLMSRARDPPPDGFPTDTRA